MENPNFGNLATLPEREKTHLTTVQGGVETTDYCYFKWANPGLYFVYFRLFHMTQLNWNSNFGQSRIEGADESTELWRHPNGLLFIQNKMAF